MVPGLGGNSASKNGLSRRLGGLLGADSAPQRALRRAPRALIGVVGAGVGAGAALLTRRRRRAEQPTKQAGPAKASKARRARKRKPTPGVSEAKKASVASRPTEAEVPTFSVTSSSFGDGDAIPAKFAFGVPAEEGHASPAGGNRNPELRWSGAPAGTRSFAVLAFDPDVPSDPSDVNVEGRTIPFDAARADFAHWLVVDIPVHVSEIAEGADSDGITPRGKPTGPTDFGGVRGANDYTAFLAADPDMGGTYGGYDGPFPPWNDERVHRYRFVVYALDVPTLGLAGDFALENARRAMEGHVLGEAEWGGTYALNPAARAA